MGQWMTAIPSYRYSYTGFKHDNNYDIINYITLTHNDVDDNITKWGNKGLFRRCLVGVTEAVVVNSKLWSRKTGDEYSTGNLESRLFHDYATALGAGFDIIDYETHCKIAHLFYAKYADRNPQGMDRFGTGEDSFDRIIGTTSSLGNNDGKTSTQISFLGIEDFYGGKSEFIIVTLDILTVQMDAGRELLGLVMERAFTTESLFSQMEDLGHTKGLVSSTEELCKL